MKIPGGLLVVLSVALVAAAALAADVASVVKERQAAMESVGEGIQPLGAMARGKAPFDAEVVKSSAQTIAKHLEKAAGLFPAGSDAAGDIETWAKPEIWTDRENFDKTLQSTIAAAVAMQSVTAEADFGPALGKLGGGCKSCHDAYRRPKEH